MEKLTREELEMCEIAVGIVLDRIDFTSENKAKWVSLFDRLGALQRETYLTQRALDAASAAHAEVDSSLDIIPASVAGSQPRQ